MTVPRWVMVRAEYPSASFEVGPEDLRILINALSEHSAYYKNREAAGGVAGEESARIKDMLNTLYDLRHELEMGFGPRPTTKKEAWAVP